MEHAHNYISLKVNESLSKNEVNTWKELIIKFGPNGILGTASITVKGTQKTSDFYIMKTQNGYEYVIPLTRDLLKDEAAKIALIWDKLYKNDFVIDFSQIEQSKLRKKQQKQHVLKTLSENLAKIFHREWVDEKVSFHWNYGTKYNPIKKQHPMLLPWEQLSNKHRNDEINKIMKLFSILESINLHLVKK